MMKVTKAKCCRHCKHTTTEYIFIDAVLCFKTNEYRSHTEVCEEHEEKEE